MALVDQRVITVLKIEETGSFTKAANALYLTQPAVSQHVKSLEEELNIKIFDRNQKTIKLTSEGEIAVKYFRRLLSISENMGQALKEEKTKIASLTIGITHTVESTDVMEVLAEYALLQRGISVKIISDTSEKLYRKLRNDEIDFIIMEGYMEGRDLKYTNLGTDSIVLITAPGHRLASQEMVTLDQLKKENLILRRPNSNTRQIFEHFLKDRNQSMENFNVIMEVDNIASIKDLVRRGYGVSVLSRSACADELSKGKLAAKQVEDLSIIRQINIVTMPEFDHPEITEALAESFRQKPLMEK